MRSRLRSPFTTIRTEGAMLPADLLQRVLAGDNDLDGLTPESYHLSGEKLNEAINRSWNRLQGAWAAFREAAGKLPTGDPATTVTRERWLLPVCQELGYGRLVAAKALEIEGKSYAISHQWGEVPLHLVGAGVEPDTRARGVAGAARSSPHSLVQEVLNRSDSRLWGFVSNGLRWRVLRDNASLTRQAFVEFDLEAMFSGEVYADFAVFWLVGHQSRVEAERPETCWLEQWSRAAQQRGTRALDNLRKGVEDAISALGSGFLAHPANVALRDKLRAGNLDKQDYYRQLLRLVYRLIFLFVAEDRELLLAPDADPAAKERYLRYYSTARLRRLADRLRGGRHADLYVAVRLVMGKLGQGGSPDLGLPELGSFLWSPDAISDLAGCELANADLLAAVRALAFTQEGRVRRAVDYRNLGPEELGSVYESLLELHPELNTTAATFSLHAASGSERKTTGSYYTPSSLIQCLLDSALDPVIAEAMKQPDPEAALLRLKVCDPACGSGHFLIAAAHRLARRLASVRSGEAEPAPEALRTALRDVIGRCLYGVDVNPMSVELCKVSLWMEALEPGKPLSFLDHHIQQGNSLIGATPALLARGIPDEAFTPIEGDDKKYCAEFKKRNKQERAGQMSFALDAERPAWERLGDLAAGMAHLEAAPDDTPAAVRAKQAEYEALVRSAGYEFGRLWADAWCAAFVWKKTREFEYPITEARFREIERNPFNLAPWMRDEIQRLARLYSFFHWHLAFPEVFRPLEGQPDADEVKGWEGGFDCVLGNPPWVRQEHFKPIKNLLETYVSFSGTADLSVFFLELATKLISSQGRSALLTPNKWFRAAYGESLRRQLRQIVRLQLVIDFGHSKTLFIDADTFPAGIVFSASDLPVQNDIPLRYVRAYDEDREKNSLRELIAAHSMEVSHGALNEGGWVFNESRVDTVLREMRRHSVSLAAAVGRPPLYGLKTGLNNAFYLDDRAAREIIQAEPQSTPLIKPFLRGRDVKRWMVMWEQQWHIVIPSSQNKQWPWTNAKGETEAESIFAATHPSLHWHLKRYEDGLRHRTDQGKYWWELRSCDYYERFQEPKIVISRISYHSACGLDPTGYFQNDSTVFIPSSDLFILAVLNSRVGWWYTTLIFPHKKDEAISMDADYLERFPIPDAPESVKEQIRIRCKALIDLVSKSSVISSELMALEHELSSLVWKAYNLDPSSERLLDEVIAVRDPVRVLELRQAKEGEA